MNYARPKSKLIVKINITFVYQKIINITPNDKLNTSVNKL